MRGTSRPHQPLRKHLAGGVCKHLKGHTCCTPGVLLRGQISTPLASSRAPKDEGAICQLPKSGIEL